ncbi:MAG TPA: restriction endonuclease [Lichenihabitans sp.]|jgi:restriction system protein|nr:restriction endonuclease [Lichenihabitans sp.]
MSAGVTVVIVFAALALLVLGAGKALKDRRRRTLLRTVERVTRQHARLLIVKRTQLVIHDGYGNYHLEGWIRHVNYFVDHVILREARAQGLRTGEAEEGMPWRKAVTRRFLAVLQELDGEAAGGISDEEIISGQHYETLCHNILEAAGWIVTMTPVTGDQGADLIADADGCRLVVQCKFHSKPVGNKAVQEAFAALGFHGGHRAAVVSNQAFTRAACDLARANGVLLLHHDQLRDLDRARLQRD